MNPDTPPFSASSAAPGSGLSTTIPRVASPVTAAYPAFSGYGLEIEYMIVDAHTLQVRPLAGELLKAAAGGGEPADVDRGNGMGWSNELALHVFEIKNQRPLADLGALAAAFQGEALAANDLLAPLGCRLMPGGMHPWMDPVREARLWDREPAGLYQAYDRIFDCHRHGWANVQSVHLNLPFGNDLEFARLHAAIRLVLPLLPALAASSPLAEGRVSGYLDYRLEVYRTHQMKVPTTQGEVIPDNSASPADYETRVLQPMYREIAPHDPEGLLQSEWLNARGAIPRFGRNAIEIRVLDVQECPQADCAIAALATALIRRLYEAGAAWLARHGDLPTPLLAGIFKACSQDAEAARVDDPGYLALLGFDSRPRPAGEIWAALLDELAAAGRLTTPWIDPLATIVRHGPLARRILAAAGPDPSRERLQEVYQELCRCLAEGRMFRA